jgi:cell division protein FtsB
VADDELEREKRAEELREEIERLRSGEAAVAPPRSPRDFVEEAARDAEDRPEAPQERSEED